MTRETLNLLKGLLSQVILNPVEPGFEEKARKCLAAAREIEDELNKTELGKEGG